MTPTPAYAPHRQPAAAPTTPAVGSPKTPRTGAAPPGYGHSLAAVPVSSGAPIQLARGPKNKYELPKAVKAGLKGRSDKEEIEDHFESLQRHYDKMKFIITRAERLATTNRAKGNTKLATKHNKAAKAARAKMTEAIGEMNATNKILRDRPTWRLLRGFTAGTGIDQIWKTVKSNKINVVEAKGPGAKLGISDRKGKQMSLPWVVKTAQGMANDHGIGAAIRKGKPKVRGYVITSTATGKTAQKHWQKLTYN